MDETFYPEWADPALIEPEISAELVQVGQDRFPVHPRPDWLSEAGKAYHRRKWGHGEPVVTPRLRSKLRPGELELYAGALERRLHSYAWSRTDVLGSGLVDAESLVQDALIDRWNDPRDLDDEDTERFAIMQIRNRSIDAFRKATHQAELDEEYDEEEAEFVTTWLPDHWSTRIETEFPAPTARALILIFEEQYTRQEAADEVGITKMTLSRAFATLRTWKGDI